MSTKKKPAKPNSAMRRAAQAYKQPISTREAEKLLKAYRAAFPAKAEPKPAEGCEFVRLELNSELVQRVRMVLAARGTDLATYVRLQLRAFRSSSSMLTLADKIPFGKYSGELVEDICRADPAYVEWMAANATSAKFDVDVLGLLSQLSEDAKA